MGRVKAEWMRHQELEPMYEWIDENYGEEVREEGAEAWEEAVQAYEDHCEKLLRKEEEWYVQEQLEWYIYNQSKVGEFDTQMQSVKELLRVQVKDDTQFSLLVMMHGHIVAAIESYLASTFINTVTNSEPLIKKLVETDPSFSKMKFTLKEIYEKHQSLKLTVAAYLRDLIFHDLHKVKPMFNTVLQCDFGDITWLFKAVEIRHHCVHRAGLDKDGNRVDISKNSIRILTKQAFSLVHKVEDDIDRVRDSDTYPL